MRSSKRLMIFISLPHLGHSNGSTSQHFLIHSRHVFDGIFLICGSVMFRTSVASDRVSFVPSSFLFLRSPLERFENSRVITSCVIEEATGMQRA